VSAPCPIAVLGAGSWGTALALHWARDGHPVRLWARRPELAAAIRQGTNARYLPGVEVPPSVVTQHDLDAAVESVDVLVIAVPSAAVAELCEALGARFGTGPMPPIVCAAKGLEQSTRRRMSEILHDVLGAEAARATVLLGPSHAEEVARGLPTAIVLAGADAGLRRRLQEQLASASLRIYTNDDLVGVESAAALKNILAIAAGICDGLDLGDNVKGALLTRGLAEIARLGVAMGARRETFFGLSGIGDVITTCLSRHSRNRALGELVGRGRSLEASLEAIDQVVEGVATTRTVAALARHHRVAMPISHEVERVLFKGKDPSTAIHELMTRDLKSEQESDAAARTESRR
jgi:glycerol-3-phosphate dehydrogenase (NAD(P)+)